MWITPHPDHEQDANRQQLLALSRMRRDLERDPASEPAGFCPLAMSVADLVDSKN
jgi:hypothetical protein